MKDRNIRTCGWLASGAVLLVVSWPVAAQARSLVAATPPQQSIFSKCDGYQAPSKADGLTTATWLFGLASRTADQRRSNPGIGAGGVAACDAALADPALQASFVMRRAHLLQAKAMHQIAVGHFDEALASLKESDATGRPEPLFDGSVGEGNRALKAAALYGLGRADQAESVLQELERLRPYATSLRMLASEIRTQFEDDPAKEIAMLEGQAAVNPVAQRRLFWLAMIFDDHAAALRYAPGIRFDKPRERIGWNIENSEAKKYALIEEQAEFSGALAYAQSVSGMSDAADATIREMQATIADWAKPPPQPPEGSQWSKLQRRDFEIRKTTAVMATDKLAEWEVAVTLRAEAKGKTFEEIGELIKTRRPTGLAFSSLLALSSVSGPAEKAQLQAFLKEFESRKNAARLQRERLGLEQIVAMLPRPETPAMRPKMQVEGSNILRSDLNGYGIRENEEPGSVTVRFGTATGSVAMADEAVLLAAANYAVKKGKDAFFIDTREVVQRTTYMVGMYAGGGPIPSGYEVRLCVRPVVEASIAQEQRGRLVRTNAVIADLAPKFFASR